MSQAIIAVPRFPEPSQYVYLPGWDTKQVNFFYWFAKQLHQSAFVTKILPDAYIHLIQLFPINHTDPEYVYKMDYHLDKNGIEKCRAAIILSQKSRDHEQTYNLSVYLSFRESPHHDTIHWRFPVNKYMKIVSLDALKNLFFHWLVFPIANQSKIIMKARFQYVVLSHVQESMIHAFPTPDKYVYLEGWNKNKRVDWFYWFADLLCKAAFVSKQLAHAAVCSMELFPVHGPNAMYKYEIVYAVQGTEDKNGVIQIRLSSYYDRTYDKHKRVPTLYINNRFQTVKQERDSEFPIEDYIDDNPKEVLSAAFNSWLAFPNTQSTFEQADEIGEYLIQKFADHHEKQGKRWNAVMPLVSKMQDKAYETRHFEDRWAQRAVLGNPNLAHIIGNHGLASQLRDLTMSKNHS